MSHIDLKFALKQQDTPPALEVIELRPCPACPDQENAALIAPNVDLCEDCLPIVTKDWEEWNQNRYAAQTHAEDLQWK